jgi:hypothetical protein
MVECDTPELKVIGRAGAGNTLISEIVLEELANNHYDQVNVLWSGINRIDVPIGLTLHQVIKGYEYCYQLQDVVWYSSGGYGASGFGHECPREIKKIFKTMYSGASPKHLTNLTCSSMIKVQTLLKSKNIPYHMSFIYDIHQSIEGTWLECVLGKFDPTASLYPLVDWNTIQTLDTPYEWCKSQDLLSSDGFHPSDDGIKQWYKKHVNLDIFPRTLDLKS